MQIVIDIDENLYVRLFDIGVNNVMDMRRACRAIRGGTPLPKGHGRLIDADKLHYVKMLVQNPNNGKHKHIVAVRASEINKAPTIIEADKAESE